MSFAMGNRLFIQPARLPAAFFARFEIGRQQDLRGQLVEPGFALLLGELRRREKAFGLARSESLVEELDGHAGDSPEPFAERAGFARFLALMSIEMNRQADDEPHDPLLFGQTIEKGGIGGFPAPRVVLKWA